MLRDFHSYDWFTISLLLVGIGFIFLKQFNPGRYLKFFQLLYSKSYFKVKVKETRFISTFEHIAFVIANIIAAQWFYLYLIEKDYSGLIFSLPAFNITALFLLISVFYFLKYHLEKLVNYCFANHKLISFYLFYKQTIWSYAIFLSLPLLIIYVYMPGKHISLVYVTIFISTLYYLVNTLYFVYKNRSIALGNWYYIILYLCALEIAPYYILYNLIAIA
jgi:hypothetical protein